MDIMSFAMSMINNNPQIANNPRAKSMIDVLKSGDSARGEELARNLCNTYGISQEDALEQAKSYFGL